ncbi:hypothetical protein HY440_01130 [Candidatus Microgenomates bacterium]|nr:hypothetical protein [Candidatus Microgenomates bacterium]
MKWTTTKFIAAGSLGVLSLLLEIPASSLAILSGVPLMGGFINIFIAPVFDSLTPLLISSFGAATIQRGVIALLSLPLALGGPPGFFPKVIIMLIQGLLVDLIFLALKANRKAAAIIAAAVSTIYYTLAFVFVGKLFALPGIDQTIKLFLSPLLLVGSLVAGGFSGYLAWLIYNRVKRTSIVARIQGNYD